MSGLRYDSIKLMILFGLVLDGCTTSPKSTQVVTTEPSLKAEASVALKITDPSTKVVGTANNVQVREIRTSSINNLLYVQAEVQNARGRRDVFDYRLRWLDQNGLQVVPYASWDTVSLEGQEISIINFTAPRPDATDFRLEIKAHY